MKKKLLLGQKRFFLFKLFIKFKTDLYLLEPWCFDLICLLRLEESLQA